MTIPAARATTIDVDTGPAQGRRGKELTDLAVMIGGQGGDGSLTVSDLLGRYFRKQGLYVYASRNVLSRIRGGHADASVRASREPIAASKPKVDVIVAFDNEAVTYGRQELEDDGFILFDSSVFQTDVPNSQGFPFATLVGGALGQPIFKNTAAYGALSVILGFDEAATRAVIEERFKRRSAEALEKNLRALEIGRKAALELPDFANRWSVAPGEAHDQILTTGNQAVALGFVVGGGRFFAGYPITPATEIMEYLMRYLPSFHGVVRQAEDELAAINMIMGAAYAGARVMTSTSGPGLSLMTEGIGHAGTAEIPILVADCQRVGPSTGQPTRNEQSDLAHLAHIGHGEFPRFILAPGTIDDCFGLTVDALNLAEKWRVPVILLLDQALCQNSVTSAPLRLDTVRVERGKLLTAAEMEGAASYMRYQLTPDGISPSLPPGTPGFTAQVTGNEHNEWGHVSVDPANRVKMMRKRMEKLTLAAPDLPLPRYYGDSEAKLGIIGFGSTWGPIREAQEILAATGTPTRFLQARTLFPVQTATLDPFLTKVDTAFIVEHNYTGQLAGLIRDALPQHHAKLRSILKFDGTSFRSPDIVRSIRGN
ncbi:MAG: 2-oxoacid:acceptor oxidoreductase subunit alpha [Thermoplasmata archaeon]